LVYQPFTKSGTARFGSVKFGAMKTILKAVNECLSICTFPRLWNDVAEIRPESNPHTVLFGISDFSKNRRIDGRAGLVERLKLHVDYTCTVKL
jgi:hypothetical protein